MGVTKKMLNAFYNPVEALHDAKAEKSIGTTLIVLVIAAVLTALAAWIAMGVFSWYVELIIIVVAVVSALVSGLLLKVALSILGAKDPSYFAGLTAATYSLAPLSAALVVSAILAKIPVLGIVLVILLMMVAGVAMGATLIRGVMELAHADLLMALVSAWVVLGIGMMIGYVMTVVVAVMRSMMMGGMPMGF
jgi:hypothetical protein